MSNPRFLISESELTRSQVAAIKDHLKYRELKPWKADLPTGPSNVNEVTRRATREPDSIQDDPKDRKFRKLMIGMFLTFASLFLLLHEGLLDWIYFLFV